MGRDGADTSEWVAVQEWSNGKVAFVGNSYLAISQWFIAAECPPHLSAIAPWEGFSEVFHHCLAAGGIPDIGIAVPKCHRKHQSYLMDFQLQQSGRDRRVQEFYISLL